MGQGSHLREACSPLACTDPSWSARRQNATLQVEPGRKYRFLRGTVEYPDGSLGHVQDHLAQNDLE